MNLRIGKTFESSVATLTVQKWDKKVPTPDIQETPVMQAALVKACVTSDAEGPLSFGWSPWTLVDGDGGRFPSSGYVWGGMPKPVYPNGETEGSYSKGECVKGWILFETRDVKGVKLRYNNSEGETAAWKLP